NASPEGVLDAMRRVKTRGASPVGAVAEDPERELLRAAGLVGGLESMAFADGVMLGHVSLAVPFRIDSLLRLGGSVEISHTTAAQAGLFIGSPDDQVVVLRAALPIGRIEVA